jgi:acyl transferase domain-containing protein/3-hydroxymyristoyl/3-hydroxydecanoyl-(acyl carrier protein) dehydratase
MSMGQDDAVAIVGYGGVFPGANDPEGLWSNVVEGVDATRDVPPGRWILEPRDAYDPRVSKLDRVYATRGGFIEGFQPDLGGLNLDRELVDRLDPMFHLALHAAARAWSSARTEEVDRGRVGVIFGNIVLPTETSSAYSWQVLGRAIEEGLGVPAARGESTEPLNAFPAGLPAAMVARALGLGGTAFTLDAACASSLYALKLAADELRSGRAGAMIAGGLSRPDPLYTQMGFSQLLALSARGRPAPFDESGDGLIVGEGAGLFVLKRLGDAIRHGDNIHGVIRGIGLSNDVHGDLLAPSSEGQLRAMHAAYEQAGWSPHDVDLIECHATGTPVGDSVEVESLRKLWGDDGAPDSRRCVIGSVKSNVGHMLTAAGAAGLIKLLQALKHQVLPPTANHRQAAPRLGLDGGPFRVLKSPEPWPAREDGRPRRAAISGFGFGGINAHVLIEEWPGSLPAASPTGVRPARESRKTPIAIVGLGAHFGPFEGLAAFQRRVLGGETGCDPGPPRRWWADPGALGDALPVQGLYLESFRLGADRFRIPPRELQEMLAQQSLMLKVAAEAIADSGWDPGLGQRTGVVMGLGLDLNTNNFQLRWRLIDMVRRWNRELGLELSEAELDDWLGALREAVCPPLTANRTMGSLGGLVASRIAREFRIGGPSFSVSCDETSGTQALQIAAGWLQAGELDAAIVGAVDLAGDLRAVLAANAVCSKGQPGEGAVALVLKRLDDALRDGDRVYATIQSASASTGRLAGARAELCVESSGTSSAIAIQRAIGRTGAAAGLASIAQAALSLYHQIVPPSGGEGGPAESVSRPRFWLRNRSDGPRRTGIAVTGLGGTDHRVVLEGIEETEHPGAFREGERLRPLGPHRSSLFAIEADDVAGLSEELGVLLSIIEKSSDRPLETLAREWFEHHPTDHRRELGMALIADDAGRLRRAIETARSALRGGGEVVPPSMPGLRIFPPRAVRGRIAFIFPGLGNVFAGMGRELSSLWPEILREQDARNARLRDQVAPGTWWEGDLPARFEDHRAPILGQVSVGSFTTDLLHRFGVRPDAAIGYSMGESAALVALGAWNDRDEMARRLVESSLFASELAGPCRAARRAWGLEPGEPADWVAGIVPCSSSTVQAAIGDRARVYVLIKNSADETVIGGQRSAVRAVVGALDCPFLELPIVSTVHCEVGRVVEAEYRALHDLPTSTPVGITFYSGVWARPYAPDRASAAEAISAQATQPIDFPAVVERAYADGVRVFLEMGPGGSCTRLIGKILGDRPHLACSASLPDRDALSTVLEMLGNLIASRVEVNLEPHHRACKSVESPRTPRGRSSGPDRRREITIEPGLPALRLPPVPTPRSASPFEPQPTWTRPVEIPALRSDRVGTEPSIDPPLITVPPMISADLAPLTRKLFDAERAQADAHESFLKVSQGYSELVGKNLEYQFGLISAAAQAGWEGEALPRIEHEPLPDEPGVASLRTDAAREVTHDRDQCLEFAIGSIGAVLGAEFAEIDSHPTRVRLPDEPLMLVDRIVTVEGEKKSMTQGRVVTEHDISPGAWYLDAGKIPPCIAIEAGQADLFLSGYLGIDFITKGLAVYRLLDATVTFHRGLPGPGEVIRYDIRITHFFRQGETHLFRFEFTGTVDGEPLLTMRDGCAGFFSAHELAAGKGIVPRPLDSRPVAGVRPADWTELVPVAASRLDEGQVEALRRGDLAAGFGAPFGQLDLTDPLPLPGGRLTLVHRVETLDPRGGRFGLGLIRAEADIHPDDWFMVCHFVDDRVMPGTLMYECCLHTLRIFLMRMGWVGASDRVAFEPLPGVANRLRCRGQVIESTRMVTYEVAIKQLGSGPEPFALADALMYAAGKPIVEITDMALRLSGTTREELERLWRTGPDSLSSRSPSRTVACTREQILAFATGRPSDCFGERYRLFDEGRFIARFPAPPYSFLDRVIEVDGAPWTMAAGTGARAEYDVPEDAWYFEADRQDRVPYAVLLEAALQTCGWVSAYMGSALASDEPLKYRNLGGTATVHAPVDRGSGTLTTSVRAAKVTRSAGMIIQHYEFSVRTVSAAVFDGETYFGFFHPDALAGQAGIRDAVPYELTQEEAALARSFSIPDRAPLPDRRWRMVDRIESYAADGGPHGQGVIVGSMEVEPGAWFFKAHFLGDPVWPGSLGLESFLQLLKVVAVDRWGLAGDAVFESPTAQPHRWVYRGQILPTNHRVETRAVITARDDRRRWLKADGYLLVDGKLIYQMNDFTLRADSAPGRGS